MTECDRCGGHVTPQFRRVFSDQEGRVFGCPRCMDQREILRGKPAEPPADADTRKGQWSYDGD